LNLGKINLAYRKRDDLNSSVRNNPLIWKVKIILEKNTTMKKEEISQFLNVIEKLVSQDDQNRKKNERKIYLILKEIVYHLYLLL
jgi:hypothetical protein